MLLFLTKIIKWCHHHITRFSLDQGKTTEATSNTDEEETTSAVLEVSVEKNRNSWWDTIFGAKQGRCGTDCTIL